MAKFSTLNRPMVSETPSVSPEHQKNLDIASKYHNTFGIKPEKISHFFPGDYEKDESGEIIKELDKATGTMVPKQHFTPYADIAKDEKKLSSYVENLGMEDALKGVEGRAKAREESMKLPENIGPVTSRVLSHKSFDEMDDKDQNMFKTFYNEATKENFIPHLKSNVLGSKEDEGEMALFIDDWSDAIRNNKGLHSAILDQIPSGLIANVSEAEEPEIMAKYLYSANDKALDNIQNAYFNTALKQIIRHKKGA